MWEHPSYTLHVPRVSTGRAGFPDIPSAGGGAGAGQRQTFAPAQWLAPCWDRDGGKGRAQAGSVPCAVCFPSLRWKPCLRAGKYWPKWHSTWTLCRQKAELSACWGCTCSPALLTCSLMCMSALPLTAHHHAQPPPIALLMGPPCRVPGACVEPPCISCRSCGAEAAAEC